MNTIERKVELTEREGIELARVLYLQITCALPSTRKSENRELVLYGGVLEKLLLEFPELLNKDVISEDHPTLMLKDELPKIKQILEEAKKVISCQS